MLVDMLAMRLQAPAADALLVKEVEIESIQEKLARAADTEHGN